MAFGVGVQLNQANISAVKAEFSNLIKQLQQQANSNIIQLRVGNAQSEINRLTGGINGLNNTVNSSNSRFKNMESSVQSLTGFFLKWLSVTTAVTGAIYILKSGIEEINSINRSNTVVAMITNDSIENVKKMNKGYLEMAKNLKVVNSEVLAGAESWLRSGVDISEANANLITTTKLAKIAGESNSDMADSLIVVKNAYDLNSQSLEGYASKVSLLDNQSATSSDKINKAMEYSAESFKSAGIK